MLGLTPTYYGRSGAAGTPPKLGWNSLCLCEIIPCAWLTYRIGVHHLGIARDYPGLQRALTASDCTPCRDCLSRAVTHVCVLTVIFTRSVYCFTRKCAAVSGTTRSCCRSARPTDIIRSGGTNRLMVPSVRRSTVGDRAAGVHGSWTPCRRR